MQHQLVPLDREVIDRETGKPAEFGAILSGDPRETFLNVFDSGNARFACGVWQCTPGIIAMSDWPYDEFCVLLAGRVVITPQDGQAREYRQGDAFVIPKGFTGTWDVQETIRKYYAIQRHGGRAEALKRYIPAPLLVPLLFVARKLLHRQPARQPTSHGLSRNG